MLAVVSNLLPSALHVEIEWSVFLDSTKHFVWCDAIASQTHRSLQMQVSYQDEMIWSVCWDYLCLCILLRILRTYVSVFAQPVFLECVLKKAEKRIYWNTNSFTYLSSENFLTSVVFIIIEWKSFMWILRSLGLLHDFLQSLHLKTSYFSLQTVRWYRNRLLFTVEILPHLLHLCCF